MPEESAPEEPVGVVEHFYPKVSVAVVKVEHGTLHRGDRIRIVGHGVDLEETIRSLEKDHEPIEEAHEGEEVGVWVVARVHEKDKVFLIQAGP